MTPANTLQPVADALAEVVAAQKCAKGFMASPSYQVARALQDVVLAAQYALGDVHALNGSTHAVTTDALREALWAACQRIASANHTPTESNES